MDIEDDDYMCNCGTKISIDREEDVLRKHMDDCPSFKNRFEQVVSMSDLLFSDARTLQEVNIIRNLLISNAQTYVNRFRNDSYEIPNEARPNNMSQSSRKYVQGSRLGLDNLQKKVQNPGSK